MKLGYKDIFIALTGMIEIDKSTIWIFFLELLPMKKREEERGKARGQWMNEGGTKELLNICWKETRRERIL